MKLYVCNVKTTEKSVFVEGIRHIKVSDNKFDAKPYNIRFDKEYYAKAMKDKKLSFPIVFDLTFDKGWKFVS